MENASFSMLLHHKLSDKLKAFSTTRHGGCGTGNYSTMNINRFCGDNIDVINKNLNILCAEIGIDSDKIIMPHQTWYRNTSNHQQLSIFNSATKK